jgi:hypothetical protein
MAPEIFEDPGENIIEVAGKDQKYIPSKMELVAVYDDIQKPLSNVAMGDRAWQTGVHLGGKQTKLYRISVTISEVWLPTSEFLVERSMT